MKDIGLKLKEKREENGVSIEEAAEDLKMRPGQIIALEEGNQEEFKDVLSLKYFIRDYAKYLGLDGEKLVDEFNEFLFDFTSKIPIGDIEKAKENKKNNKDITSPYTKAVNVNLKQRWVIGIIILVLIVLIVGYVIMSNIHKNDFMDNNTTYVIRR